MEDQNNGENNKAIHINCATVWKDQDGHPIALLYTFPVEEVRENLGLSDLKNDPEQISERLTAFMHRTLRIILHHAKETYKGEFQFMDAAGDSSDQYICVFVVRDDFAVAKMAQVERAMETASGKAPENSSSEGEGTGAQNNPKTAAEEQGKKAGRSKGKASDCYIGFHFASISDAAAAARAAGQKADLCKSWLCRDRDGYALVLCISCAADEGENPEKACDTGKLSAVFSEYGQPIDSENRCRYLIRRESLIKKNALQKLLEL